MDKCFDNKENVERIAQRVREGDKTVSLNELSTISKAYPDLVDSYFGRYFTPLIEDIRVGYECEIRRLQLSELGGASVNRAQVLEILSKKEYEKYTIKQPDLQMLFFSGLEGVVRVPYLSKEQIEKEGWVEYANMFEKGGNHMKFLNGHDIIISHAGFSKFCGQCKDINTFRHICKLLGI